MRDVYSDTDVVCDWSGVAPDSFEMPRCTQGVTCAGHRADDLLPFEGVLEGDAPSATARNPPLRSRRPRAAPSPSVLSSRAWR